MTRYNPLMITDKYPFLDAYIAAQDEHSKTRLRQLIDQFPTLPEETQTLLTSYLDIKLDIVEYIENDHEDTISAIIESIARDKIPFPVVYSYFSDEHENQLTEFVCEVEIYMAEVLKSAPEDKKYIDFGIYNAAEHAVCYMIRMYKDEEKHTDVFIFNPTGYRSYEGKFIPSKPGKLIQKGLRKSANVYANLTQLQFDEVSCFLFSIEFMLNFTRVSYMHSGYLKAYADDTQITFYDRIRKLSVYTTPDANLVRLPPYFCKSIQSQSSEYGAQSISVNDARPLSKKGHSYQQCVSLHQEEKAEGVTNQRIKYKSIKWFFKALEWVLASKGKEFTRVRCMRSFNDEQYVHKLYNLLIAHQPNNLALQQDFNTFKQHAYQLSPPLSFISDSLFQAMINPDNSQVLQTFIEKNKLPNFLVKILSQRWLQFQHLSDAGKQQSLLQIAEFLLRYTQMDTDQFYHEISILNNNELTKAMVDHPIWESKRPKDAICLLKLTMLYWEKTPHSQAEKKQQLNRLLSIYANQDNCYFGFRYYDVQYFIALLLKDEVLGLLEQPQLDIISHELDRLETYYKNDCYRRMKDFLTTSNDIDFQIAVKLLYIKMPVSEDLSKALIKQHPSARLLLYFLSLQDGMEVKLQDDEMMIHASLAPYQHYGLNMSTIRRFPSNSTVHYS